MGFQRFRKRMLSVNIVLLVLAFGFVGPASAQFGFSAGLNFDKLGDVKTGDRKATFDNATGYHVGLFFDLGAGIVSVRPGVFLHRFGDVVVVEDALTTKFDLNSIEVPIDVRIRALSVPAVRPYVLVGPVFSFASSNDAAFNDALRELTMSGNVGGGLELTLPGTDVTLYPEVRFSIGLMSLLEEGKEINIGGSTIVADEASSLQTVMLRLSLRL